MTMLAPDIPDLEFEPAPAVAKRRLYLPGDDEDEDDEDFEERIAYLPQREQQRQRRIRSERTQGRLATQAAERAGTTDNLTLLARAALESPVSKQARQIGGDVLSAPSRLMATGAEELGFEGAAEGYRRGARIQQGVGEEIGDFLAPSAIDVLGVAGVADDLAAVGKKVVKSPLAQRLINEEAGSVRLPGGDDLEALLGQSMDLLRKDRGGALEAFGKNAADETAIIKAEQAAEGAQYAEATELSKRVAQMTGADAAAVRKRAIGRTKQALDEMKATLQRRADELITDETGSVTVPDADLRETAGLAKRALGNVSSVAGDLISLKSSLSPPLLRQGKARLVTNPVAAFKELGQSFRAAVSEESAEGIARTIREDPWVRSTESLKGATTAKQLGEPVPTGMGAIGNAPNKGLTWEDVGGTILEWGDSADVDKRVEERALNRGTWLSNKIRGAAPIKMSDRQAATMLNLNRTNWYREVASNMWAAGNHEADDYKKLRGFIEHVTHRGSWKQPDMPLFFSTRAQSGRAQALWDIAREVPYGVVSGKITKPGVQQEAAKALVGMTASNMAMMGSLAALGLGTLEFKDGLPTLKRGPDHFDPWAGWNAQAKLVVGIGKDLVDNYGDALNEGSIENFPQAAIHDIADRGLRFMRGGLSPAFSVGVSAATGEDFLGKEYNLADEFKSGKLAADLTLPFIVEQIANAYNEGGLSSVATTTLPAAFSEGVNTYTTPTDVRDQQAQALYGETYEDLLPTQQFEVNQTPEVKDKLGESPSAYRRAVDREIGPIREKVTQAEEAFKSGQLTQKLTDIWHDLSIEQRAKKETLVNEYLKDFKGDKDQFRKLVGRMYSKEAEVRNTDGTIDWDATEANQQRILGSLSQTEQDWWADYQKAQRLDETPLRQEYLGYIDQKDSKGYFKEGITAKEREALDKANPELDVQGWYFGGGLKDKAGPALQTAQAVNMALQKAPDRPVKLDGVSRAVNENEGTVAAFKEYGQRAANFLSGVQVERDKERIAKSKYNKSWDALTDSQKQSVTTHIRNGVLESAPDLEAYLAWMGQRTTISRDPKAIATLRYLRQTYGREPEGKDGPIKYHD